MNSIFGSEYAEYSSFLECGRFGGFQWNKLNADLVNFVYPCRYTALVAAATALHFERFKLQASLLGTFVHETTKVPNAAAGDKHKYTPTVVASWQPFKNEDLNLRAFTKDIPHADAE